mgnify:CR=1 FL=1
MEPPSPDDVWAAITTEPTTGVSIVDLEGKLLFVNEQAVRIYVGGDTQPDNIVNRHLSDFLPNDFVEERMAILRQVAEDHKPRLIRSIWRGYQHLAWVYPLDADGEEEHTEAPVDRLLVITRRTAERGDELESPRQNAYEFVHAEVGDLGPLEVLSRRELVVLALLGQGLTLKEVAERVHRSLKTVQTQRDSIGRKLNVRNRSELQEIILRAGLTLRDVEEQNR